MAYEYDRFEREEGGGGSEGWFHISHLQQWSS